MQRGAGILMPISSLPSKYGIGTFGKAAFDYVDFLKEAGIKYWQLLPLGPTSCGDSPYSSFSSFAGNPYFVDFDILIEEKKITKAEVSKYEWGSNPRYVDYGKLFEGRFEVLKLAKERTWEKEQSQISKFISESGAWLENYALFMAIKKHFKMKSWQEWPDEDIRLRKGNSINEYKAKLKEDIELYIYIQYEFYNQWAKLKKYINDAGIKIIGDLPIYVALDSADVWAESNWFWLDEKNVPVKIAGVPPDYFTKDGQLWGNPLYDWQAMKNDGYGWWIRRIEGARKLFDIIRIDHFRGFYEYWAVPVKDKTAVNGQWMKGPNMEFINAIKGWFGGLEFIAEDLGEYNPGVDQMLLDSGFPGMKVLEFGFTAGQQSGYMPHNYPVNCVCYTGTHDNATVEEWKATASKKDVDYAMNYLGTMKNEKFSWSMIKGGMRSVAILFVAQMQDYLGLGKYNRINEPGTVGDNWQWRMLEGEASKELAESIRNIVNMYGR